MSDRYQTLVILGAEREKAYTEKLALEFLWDGEVIGREPDSGGYPPGRRAGRYADAPRGNRGQIPFGVVEVDRLRFHGDINEPVSAECPQCHAVQEGLEWWKPPLEQVLKAIDKANPSLSCPKCGRKTDIRKWAFNPPVAFGIPAFNFANWPPLSQQLVDELAEAVGKPVRLVHWTV
jgi:hypothetical protein